MLRCSLLYLTLLYVVPFALAQSGDFEATEDPTTTKTITSSPPRDTTEFYSQEHLIPTYTPKVKNASTHRPDVTQEIDEPYRNVAEHPMENPTCLLQTLPDFTESSNPAQSKLNERNPLTRFDLISKKIQLATFLAVSRYSELNSPLEMVKILGGCKMALAGELIFLAFKARETRACVEGGVVIDNQAINCTISQAFMTFNRECRARVHISSYAPWNPFFVNCKSAEYYALPWRRVSS